MANPTVQTGLRLPEPLYEQLQNRASKMGVSLNALILMLVDIGATLMDNGFIHPDLRK